MSKPTTLAVDAITIGPRYRRDLGKIEVLAESIRAVGLLHPIVIDEHYTLIAGARRLAAVRQLGWEKVPVHVVSLQDIIRGEYHENIVRKDFLPTEHAAIAEVIRPLEEQAAKERKAHGGPRGGKLPPGGRAKTRDKVAAALGISGRTLDKAIKVVEVARQNPKVYGDLPTLMDKKGVDPAYREMRRRQKRITEATAAPVDLSEMAVDIRPGDFRTVLNDIPAGSVALVLTDPPYGEEFLPLWDDLGKFAKRVLRPGGLLVSYSGQKFLPTVFQSLSKHLEYVWTVAIVHSGSFHQMHFFHIQVGWKPVVVFAQPPRAVPNWWVDTIMHGHREKGTHQWQQSEAEARALVNAFTAPGDTVVDPFVGSGTAAAAAALGGRKFIGCDADREAVLAARRRVRKATEQAQEATNDTA